MTDLSFMVHASNRDFKLPDSADMAGLLTVNLAKQKLQLLSEKMPKRNLSDGVMVNRFMVMRLWSAIVKISHIDF